MDSAALAILVAVDMAVGIGVQSVCDRTAGPWAPRAVRMAVVGMVVAGIPDVDIAALDTTVAGMVVDPGSGNVAAVKDNIAVPILGIDGHGAKNVGV